LTVLACLCPCFFAALAGRAKAKEKNNTRITAAALENHLFTRVLLRSIESGFGRGHPSTRLPAETQIRRQDAGRDNPSNTTAPATDREAAVRKISKLDSTRENLGLFRKVGRENRE